MPREQAEMRPGSHIVRSVLMLKLFLAIPVPCQRHLRAWRDQTGDPGKCEMRDCGIQTVVLMKRTE